MLKFFYVMGKALSGELSCPCDRSCLNMEFALKYGVWEWLRHEKIPETHAVAMLLTENTWLLNGKKISCISGISKLVQNI